jgi:hypothetical protein
MIPYFPQSNAYAEKYGGDVKNAARAHLFAAGFPPMFWGILILLSVFIKNRIVRSEGCSHAGKAPIEVFKKKPINFRKLHVPGSLCCWFLARPLQGDPAFGSRSAVGVYISLADIVGQQGHLVFTAEGKFRAVAAVTVNERVLPFKEALMRKLLARVHDALPDHNTHPDPDDDDEVVIPVPDVDTLVMDDGVLTKDLIGQRITDYYDGKLENAQVVECDFDGDEIVFWCDFDKD